MKRARDSFKNFVTALKVGWFLAIRQLKRSSYATTGLIIFVMMLTFLNLVVVRGVLVGLIQGSEEVYKTAYAGDIIISVLPKKSYIEDSPTVIEQIKNLPWIKSYSARYIIGGKVEAGYKERVRVTDAPNSAGGSITGINPINEENTTGVASKIIEGRFLTSSDTDSIVLGADLLKKYVPVESPGFSLLENVEVGDKVRITVNGNIKEMTIIGIIRSKAGEVDSRVFMLDTTLRSFIGRTDYNVDEIAIALKPGVDSIMVKNTLKAGRAGEVARVQTAEEALPKFLLDIKATFALLGNVVGSIGLVVASITIFIVIFVNAITRRKFIGILKGIGINAVAIEFAYVLQSVFYASIGIAAGLAVLYGVLVPYVDANPIKFPFSDGILVAELGSTLFRAGMLMIATLIAGYIPARIVVKQNTLDAILGRK